jgi:hypothetical protein
MDELIAAIVRRVASGALPKDECLVSWRQAGRGERCQVCDARVLGRELLVQCDFPGERTWHFHERCHQLWYAVIKGEPLDK